MPKSAHYSLVSLTWFSLMLNISSIHPRESSWILLHSLCFFSIREPEYYRTGKSQKCSTLLRQHHRVSFVAPFKISRSDTVHYLYSEFWCHSSQNSSIQKTEIQNIIFALRREMFLLGKKQPRYCTLWNMPPCLILVISSCCIYIHTDTHI